MSNAEHRLSVQAVLALSEVKAATADFDSGEISVMEAVHRIAVALQAIGIVDCVGLRKAA
jgi:hypothetical protein